LVAKFEHNVENDCYTCLQEETLKIQEDGIKKVVAQNKAVINLKKYRTPAC
jgi:hypothetical protein